MQEPNHNVDQVRRSPCRSNPWLYLLHQGKRKLCRSVSYERAIEQKWLTSVVFRMHRTYLHCACRMWILPRGIGWFRARACGSGASEANYDLSYPNSRILCVYTGARIAALHVKIIYLSRLHAYLHGKQRHSNQRLLCCSEAKSKRFIGIL